MFVLFILAKTKEFSLKIQIITYFPVGMQVAYLTLCKQERRSGIESDVQTHS